jgi:hypothetical protein
MRDGETRGRRGALTLEQMAANFRKLDANASERQLANESRVTRRRVQQVLDDNEMTWDAFKKWALQGPITLMIPVEGAQVRLLGAKRRRGASLKTSRRNEKHFYCFASGGLRDLRRLYTHTQAVGVSFKERRRLTLNSPKWVTIQTTAQALDACRKSISQ